MSLIGAELRAVWDVLRAQKGERRFHLDEVQVRNFRGIKQLRVELRYPVSVLAGPNGCGKTTVLMACACAYQPLDESSNTLTPARVFPNFTDRLRGTLSDDVGQAEFAYYYVDDDERRAMVWRRSKSAWRSSFMGQRGGRQPRRTVYLRTLANLANPAEARGILGLVRETYRSAALTPDLLHLANRILRPRYEQVSIIRGEERDILFAQVQDSENTSYSEFHMSSGERTILRLSKDVSNLQDALVLIDEIETGLHPYTQQQLMLELQRLAVRQRLQIVVASHSPVVLDSVPPEGRLFLDRDEKTMDVQLLPPHRDIFQKALYGQSRERISILCEDDVAEGILLGVLDVLQPRLALRPEDFLIGRNTGRDEFPGHIRALAKFAKLRDFIFVLDGDSRDKEEYLVGIADDYGHDLRPLFLPGEGPPEEWMWEVLSDRPEQYEALVGMSAQDIRGEMGRIRQVMEGKLQRGGYAKAMMDAFARRLNRRAADLARIVGRREAEEGGFYMGELLARLTERINLWRKLQ